MSGIACPTLYKTEVFQINFVLQKLTGKLKFTQYNIVGRGNDITRLNECVMILQTTASWHNVFSDESHDPCRLTEEVPKFKTL
jgi:hypothetical protein